jgi:hypothetical protein
MFGPRLISILPDTGDRAGFVSRIAQPHASEGGSARERRAGSHWGGNKPKNMTLRPTNGTFP